MPVIIGWFYPVLVVPGYAIGLIRIQAAQNVSRQVAGFYQLLQFLVAVRPVDVV